MTKRILAIVLAVFMVAGLLPLGVVAETAAEHTQYEPLSEHDSAKHICEHCVATGAADTTPTWTAWGEGKTTLPTAEGHYYLTQDLNVTNADLTTGHVVLCLNGKTVTASGTEGNAADRIYQMKTSGSLTIVDCTAHTDADGNYTAGKITGGSATAIMYNSASTTTGSVNIYDGIFTGNKRSGSGGVICVQGKGQLNIYGGEFSGNTTGNSGGVLYVGSSNNKVYIENAVFKGNTATTSGGVIYNYKGSITLKNVLMTENSAPSAGVIVSLGSITYEDTTITGNRTVSGDYGALHHYNSSSTASVILKGKTVITGNIYGAADSTTERNLYLRNHSYKVNANALTAGASIGLSFDSGKMTATNGNQYITTNLNDFDPLPYFSCDNGLYTVRVVDAGGTTGRRMVFAEKPAEPDHPHKLCSDASCADHEELDFKKWESATSLPTSGNISLQADVVLTGAVAVEGTLNICLNGHTITVNKANTRAFALDSGDVLSITDCQGTGKITGGSRTYGGAVNAGRGSVFNLFGGAITGNTALDQEGGAVYVAGGNDTTAKGAVFNMYGGEISGNTARMGSAVRLTNPSGAGEKAQFNMYGGKITGNANTGTSTSNYAVIGADKAAVKLLGGEISGNTSASYGAVYVTANTDLTLGGNIKLQNNTVSGTAANLYLAGNARFTVEGLKDDALVAVTAAVFNRFISNTTAADCSKHFVSDSAYRMISYKDNALYIGTSTEHQHCLCAGGATTGCDHGNLVWTAWESTSSLPNADGNYYLLSDVVLKDVQWIKNRSINLCLNGHTITAAAGKRVLSTQETTILSITDCAGTGKLTGGSSNFGGCIGIQAGSTLHLFGGTITGNESLDETSGQGGAIYLQANGTLNMHGGTITENAATLGGAIYGKGQAFVNIYGGVIRSNQATTYGGAIYVRDGKSQVNLGAATFEGNKAKTGGGAVYSTGANAVLSISGTTFKNNTIEGYAGGTIFAQSSGTKLTIDGATFTGGSAQAGGAIYAGGSTTLTVDDSLFSGNYAKQGACIYEQRATVTLGKVTMENNAAGDKAAGIYVKAGTVVLDGVTIRNNTNTGSGTAITTGSDTYEGTTYYPTVEFKSGTISGHKGTSGGAILLQSKTQFTMSGGTISGNTASYAGAVYVSTGATFVMTGGTISGNTAKTNGGGIYALRSTVKLTGGTVSGNFAEKMGGGIFLSGASMTMSGSSIVSNKTGAGTGGGAIATGTATNAGVKYASALNLNGGSLSGNYGRHGGAILLQGTSKTVCTINGTKISNNEGKVDGGAIYVSTYTTLNLSNATLSGNTCQGRAGAIYHNNSKGNYKNVEFAENSSKSTGGTMLINGATSVINMEGVKIHDSISGASAGGLCHQGKGMLVMRDSEVYDCSAAEKSDGGGIYISNNTPAEIYNTKVYNCYGGDAGGIWVGLNSKVLLDGMTISDNEARDHGGGLLTRSYLLTVKNSVIENNKCGQFGGGVSSYRFPYQGVTYAPASSRVGTTIENTVIRNNVSGGVGGGAYAIMGTRFNLTNVTFTGNAAGAEGGALWSQSELTLDGLTASNNLSGGMGYAVYLETAQYDGHSYANGYNNFGGDIIVKDNQGGDLYMAETTTVAVLEKGFGENTHIEITLDSGMLTNRVFGTYHYEGGDQVYTLTYGDRSVTDPEYDATLIKAEETVQTQSAGSGDVLLYVLIGAFVLAAAAVVLLVLKKKSAASKKV